MHVHEDDPFEESFMSNAEAICDVLYMKENFRNLCDDVIYLKSNITKLCTLLLTCQLSL
jgi:hypothetical protein